MQQTLSPPARLETLDRALDAPSPLRLWHLSSLDAPTVAAVWSLGFAKTAGVRLPAWAPVLLVFVTWFVYVSDRLLDARSALRARDIHRLRQRHYFHWQSDLARRQAATIRTMRREGVERGGYRSLLARLTPRRGKSRKQDILPVPIASK